MIRTPRNFSWLIQDEIAGMARPMSVVTDLEYLRDCGIDAIVSLSEFPTHKVLLEEFGFEGMHIPIVDLTSPTIEQIEKFIDFANKQIAEKKKVVVHCDAGIGRTGTMLACYLVNRGHSAEEAISEVRRKRPGSIETVEQERTVVKYADLLSMK